jgi:hypothetical protein
MAIVVAVRVAVNDLTLRGFENLIEVPFQDSATRPVGPAFRQLDNLPCPRVELLAIAEVFAQPRADQQPVAGINRQIHAVEQSVQHPT